MSRKIFSKIIFSLSLLSLFINTDVWGQNSDSSKTKLRPVSGKNDSTIGLKKIDSIQTISKDNKLKGFIDKNANGIDDRIENIMDKGKQKGKKDQFIDRNGDGICDGRESAFGIKKAFRKRKGFRR